MSAPMAFRLLLALALVLGAGKPAVAQPAAPADAIATFIERLRELALSGDTDGLAALSVSGQNADEFVRAMTPAPTALVIKERDRTPLPGGGQRLLLEIFAARDAEARVFTWQMDVTRRRIATPPIRHRGAIARLDRLSFVSGLFRLSLDVAHQFDVQEPDVEGRPTSRCRWRAALPSWRPRRTGRQRSFCSAAAACVFSPPDPSERTQIEIFSGASSWRRSSMSSWSASGRSDFATSFPRGHAHAAGRRGGRCPTGRELFRRLHRTHAERGPQRSEPRALVAAAATGRPHRRDPHEAIRQR